MLPLICPYQKKESRNVYRQQSFFIAYTLVDITDSGNSDPKNSSVTFRQAQNQTIIQALSLRTQLVLSSVDVKLPQD